MTLCNMKCNPIPEREDWFICDRKPTICPRYKKKEVRKAVLGKPAEEDYFRDDLFYWMYSRFPHLSKLGLPRM